MIRFRQIEAFRHLIITGTGTAAAKRMQITQPAISRLISDLEEDLGFALFRREKGRLEPTVAGLRFYRAVEENFLGLERLKQVADSIRSEASESLNITCLPVLSTTLLPLVLKVFRQAHPDVVVKVDPCSLGDIMSRLQDMKTDVALSLEFAEIAGIEIEPIFETRMMCAMPSDHPLAAKTMITPQDLEGQNVIGWLPKGSLSFGVERSIIEGAGIHPHYTVETNNSHTRYAMVANGMGISIVEPFAYTVWQAHGVTIRPFDPAPSYGYVLAYPRASLRTEITLDFRRAVLEAIKHYNFTMPPHG
ncbi:MAG: LysR family transcriptional regulator [Paludibacterium sp.]|uniref:LysR substrate-binding domain-containing protein n=1 Tax=Paludibacterium sp. TaxID=1917523 RepID=UPI0025F1DCEF|nr:LysR substrate-binding domain-containing protein [Paludibacterium sp.]MBV8046518.1 LysR family transcriptional regulator [Paludibacterium sp.]MBV8649081.1 LysR family transcriptional regulator [Paludibacterium sp.]